MMMPPFGIPVILWTAMEVSARQPAVLACLATGSLFYLLFWAKLLGENLPHLAFRQGNFRREALVHAVPLVLGGGVLLLSIFLVPITNHFITPILKENYSRFGDIAQAEPNSLFISGFSGVNPLYLFLVISFGCILGWIIFRLFAGKSPEETTVEFMEPNEASEENMETEAEEAICEIWLPCLPERRKLELYANLIAVALIAVMFEVIAR